ncbi:MAG: bifunctional oligoribonuclease/PAP phosphatase NrnA [Bacteroidia bacterium]|nr:DHH family phosphoesterase [Bacteroidales bacterium]NCD42773.1 bifunctional oligoribonuclease/PAP phosphatase NrnA [Bacteroidia bacterium]MDD2322325.1 DHH family phosphoesterase [Bacteroidales bacterium]MDD3009889.1 DHH family phosphoesterase [Bacteroidales bacterium]MDD3961464.1 DHH family phosphoesterase [Bacteroidales bacterium]
MKDTQKSDNFRKILIQSQKITLITHLNPDGDAIGSLTAMGLFLEATGKIVTMITPNDFPAFLKWMPASDQIINAEKKFQQAHDALMDSDVVVYLDFNANHRAGNFSASLEAFPKLKVLMDHHPEPEDIFDLAFSEPSASSASEIVYDILTLLNEPDMPLSKAVASSLYTGIMTDTGSFNYACKDPDLYPKIGKLVEFGANPEIIHTLVYNTNTENRTRFLGFALLNRLVVLKEYKTAYIYLTKYDLRRFHYRVGDTEGFVNYTLSLKGINLGVLFTERVGHIKLSLRSNGDFSVNDFARNHFTGGGHKNAAGAESKMDLNDTIQMFRDLLPIYTSQLNADVD